MDPCFMLSNTGFHVLSNISSYIFYIDIKDKWFCPEFEKNFGGIKYTRTKTDLPFKISIKKTILASPV